MAISEPEAAKGKGDLGDRRHTVSPPNRGKRLEVEMTAAMRNKTPARVMHKPGGKGPMPARRKK